MLDRRVLLQGLLFALFCTLFLNAPSVWQAAHGHAGSALHVKLLQPDSVRYLSRMKEIVDGYPLMGNPVLKEYRTGVSPTGFIEMLVAVPMWLTGADLSSAIFWSNFLFPILTITLLFLWIRSLFGDTFLAIATIVSMSFSFGGLIEDVNPKLTLVPLGLYLCTVFLPEKPTRLPLLVRGMLLGLLFHSYSYHWTLILTFECITILHALVARQKPLYEVIKEAAYVLVPFMLIITPYALTLFSLHATPAFSDLWRHWGVIPTRFLAAPLLQAQLLLWLVPLIVARRVGILTDDRSRTLLFLILAGLIAVNSNLITGKEAEFAGHYGRVMALFLFPALYLLLRATASRVLTRTVALVMMIVVVASYVALIPGLVTRAESAELQWQKSGYEALFTWLDHNVPQESVILAPYDLAGEIPLFTRDYVFMSAQARFFPVTDDELMDRYLALVAFFPEDRQSIASGVMPVFGNYAGSLYAKERSLHQLRMLFRDSFQKTLPDFIVRQDLLRRYAEESEHPDWSSVRATLARFELDYLVTQNVPPASVADRFQKLATVGSFSIYHYLPSHELR